ncbi:hypothetical protein, partial, partial [Absidia glauca]
VDSTFKTNRLNCELFGVIANINGAGFPIAYFLFKHGRSVDSALVSQQCKVPALLLFFGALKAKRLEPLSMFCDKDPAEISAITTTWGEHTVRLCLWHLNRAVDKKLAAKRGRLGQIYDAEAAHAEFDFVDTQFLPHINNNNNEANVIICVAARRKEIKAVMHRHYCYHSLIPQDTTFKIASQIHHDSVKEMYNFCVEHQLSDAWAYLYRRWYTANMWKLWARSVVEHIPNAKSTMMIESHWRVLKRNHLYLNNQPRLDYLVYVIIQKQCTDLLYGCGFL